MSEDKSKTGSRFFKLAGMTAAVAGNYARTRLKAVFQDEEAAAKERAQAHQANGERIAKTLGELKGAAMKIGQMASVGTDILPKELSQALKSLQNEAPPVSFDTICAQIERELGAPPQRLFSEFDPEPFASASIGQVHRACTDDGREVVVKVQYPGVDSSVDSDLTHLKVALRASGLIDLDRRSLDQLFEEIRERLHEELDYCNEADNVRAFRAYHGPRHPFLVIPQVVGERSAKRVLTLTYEPGDTIHDLDPEGYSQEIRDLIGAHLYEWGLSEIFDFQSIHADPNPANIAFRPNGDLVIYDFGCVKKLKPEIVTAYRAAIVAALDEDYARLDREMINLGARRPEGPPIEPAFYKPFRDVIFEPMLQPTPFEYATSKIHDEIKTLYPAVLSHLSSFQPPVEVVFIDRAILGHYGNLRQIRARGRFLDLARKYLYPA